MEDREKQYAKTTIPWKMSKGSVERIVNMNRGKEKVEDILIRKGKEYFLLYYRAEEKKRIALLNNQARESAREFHTKKKSLSKRLYKDLHFHEPKTFSLHKGQKKSVCNNIDEMVNLKNERKSKFDLRGKEHSKLNDYTKLIAKFKKSSIESTNNILKILKKEGESRTQLNTPKASPHKLLKVKSEVENSKKTLKPCNIPSQRKRSKKY